MLTRPFAKKRRTNYFGSGAKTVSRPNIKKKDLYWDLEKGKSCSAKD